MNRQHFTGFYPSRPYWAGSSINLDDPALIYELPALMSEEILSFSEGSCKIKVYRDGMILLRIADLEILEEERSQEHGNNLVTRWGQYLDYLNCLYLISFRV